MKSMISSTMNFVTFKSQTLGQKYKILGHYNYAKMHSERAYSVYRCREIIRYFLLNHEAI